MERVETLLHKLQQQITQKAPTHEVLTTLQMMQHELVHLQQHEPIAIESKAVAMQMPFNHTNIAYTPAILNTENITPIVENTATIETVHIAIAPPIEEEKIIEILQVDEAEIEAELNEIKRNAANMHQMGIHSKPQLLFDLVDDDIPTLAQKPINSNKEINDTVQSITAASVNEVLKENITEVSDTLQDIAIKDLKKAIGINDRFLYINELFRGDEVMYERSIKTINSFAIWPEAEYWIRRELKLKLGWNDKDAAVLQFDQLVKRRFA